jgi:phosphoribosylglycinamide formyltransferase-1
MERIQSGYLSLVRPTLLISDKGAAPALRIAQGYGIETLFVDPKAFSDHDSYDSYLADEIKKKDIDLIALAGYMRIVRKPLIERFQNRIMNIHPALLPAFPGRYAQRQALEYGVKLAGCTVHFVDEGMDTGPIVLQAVVPVLQDDTEHTLSARILMEEHRIYSEAIKLYSENRLELQGRKVRIKHG